MDYSTVKNYKVDMTASDLCDAIVEAYSIDIQEVREAAKMLVDDLKYAILQMPKIYLIMSLHTNAPYVNERFGVYVFSDEHYAETFVENNKDVFGYVIKEVFANDYESLFTYLYNAGIDHIEYCNDCSKVSMPIKLHFLSNNYISNNYTARLLSRFVLLCMQEIRNDDKKYDRKDNLIDILKKNVIVESVNSTVLIPIFHESNNLIVQVPKGSNIQIATMKAANNELFFPIYTSVEEYKKNPIDNLKLIPIPLINHIENVLSNMTQNKDIKGIIVNPGSVSFGMTEPVLKAIATNKDVVQKMERE